MTIEQIIGTYGLNVFGVGVWAIATSFGGYYLGRAMEVILADAKKYELAAATVIIAAALATWVIRWYRRRQP